MPHDDETHPAPPPRAETLSIDDGARSTVSASGEPGAVPVVSPGRVPSTRTAPTRLGRFGILDPLGAGGMGSVYSAWDKELERRVAIKILHRDDRERFLREAQALARLSHPNVVKIYDVGSAEGVDFIAMELIEGQSLRRWLLERARPWREILRAFLDAGSGLAAVHAMGIVHRDFKPDNVLVGKDGTVRIADFGLARSASVSVGAPEPAHDPRARPSELLSASVTAAGAVVGTPRYMPPEQRGAGAPTPRADQYSFCMSLWEAIFRRCPDDVIDWFPGAAGRVPRKLRAILERGFAPDPGDRFASMDELMAALRQLTRRPIGVVTGAAAAVAVAAVATAAIVMTRGAPADACRHAGDFTSAWRAADGAAVVAAFTATKLAGADAAGRSAVAGLDDYARSIAAMSGEACAATRVERTQTDAVLDLRAGCLHRRFSEMRSLAGELRHADADLVHRAALVVASLPPVAECADVDALSAPMTVPPAPGQRAPVADLHTELDAIDAALLAGHYQEALPRAAAAVEQARRLGFGPLLVDALLTLGEAQTRLQDLGAAESTYVEAVDQAQAAGHDAALARAATRLVFLVCYDGRRVDEARRWSRLAAATIERYAATRAVDSAGVVKLRAQLAAALVDLERIAEHLPEAEAQAQKALALFARSDPRQTIGALHALAAILHQRGHGVEGEQLARWSLALDTEQHAPPDDLAGDLQLIGNAEVDLNRLADARVDFLRAADLAAAALGPDSLAVAASLEGIGTVDHNLEHWALALDDYQRMGAIYSKHFGPDSPKLAMIYAHEGAALSALKRSAEARAALKHALAIDEKFSPDSMDVAKVLEQLAWRDAAEQHYDDAIPEAERAVAIVEKVNPDGYELLHMLDTAGFAYAEHPDKALPLHLRAVAEAERLYGKDSRQVSDALVGLAQDQIGLKRFTDARAALERAIPLVPRPQRGARILLAQLYETTPPKKLDAARALAAQALIEAKTDHDDESIHDATELIAELAKKK